jgi:hypothetical protein
MKKIYVNDDFIDSQIIWLLPIIDGYSSRIGINHIIFKSQFSNKILKSKNFINFSKKYKIEFLSKKRNFFFYLNLFILIIKYITYTKVFFIKKIYQNNFDWHFSEFIHGYWDYCNVLLKDNLKINFFIKIKSFVICIDRLDFASELIKCNIHTAFLGHTTYFSKPLMAELRENKINVFCQASYNLYYQYQYNDNYWSKISKIDLKKLKKINLNKISLNYWSKRSQGKGNYDDANRAFRNGQLKNSKLEFKNFIFLHIFKDSPFNIVDNERIFNDYFDWFIETIKILKDSKENWLIKLHPSHVQWGENQRIVINSLLKMNKLSLPSNVFIETNNLSNVEIFKKANRIVTFSGTAHLEVACNGIKPIIISRTTLYDYIKKSVLKPKNISEYRKFLLLSSKSNFFKLNKKYILVSKKLLFIRENVLTLKKDLNSFFTYRKDSIKLKNKEFKIVNARTLKIYDKLKSLGNFLAFKINKTVSLKYLKFYK